MSMATKPSSTTEPSIHHVRLSTFSKPRFKSSIFPSSLLVRSSQTWARTYPVPGLSLCLSGKG